MIYLKVEHPHSQKLIEHEDFNECVPMTEESGAYLVPKYVYNDIFGDSELDREIKAMEEVLYRRSDNDKEDPDTLGKALSLMERVRAGHS